MSASVEFRGVTQTYGSFTAVDDVSLTIGAGEFAVILGPSGSGKTTLLSILGGFVTPTAGQVLIDNVEVTRIPPARRPTTTVFQDYALFPHLTVLANVGFGLRMRGVARRERDARALEVLELVGLGDAGAKRPHALSGGQRQRVALARALAVDPQVLLLDEPLGALDLNLRRQMQIELKAIQARVGTTFVHVTHDQEEAMAIADEIIVMNHGRVEDRGDPERVYLRPRTLFSAQFMGESNLIRANVAVSNGERLTAQSAVGQLDCEQPDESLQTGARLGLCIRPEHITVGESGPASQSLGRATIESVGFFGTYHRCEARHRVDPDLKLVVHLPQVCDLSPGDEVDLSVSASNIVALPETAR